MSSPRRVSTRTQLFEAAGSPDCPEIVVSENIDGLPSLRLGPGQSLRGEGDPALRFAPEADGVEIAADSTLSGLRIVTDPDRRAVFNDTAFAGFGQIATQSDWLRGLVCQEFFHQPTRRGAGRCVGSVYDVEHVGGAPRIGQVEPDKSSRHQVLLNQRDRHVPPADAGLQQHVLRRQVAETPRPVPVFAG